MLKWMITNLKPPVFPEDEDKTRKARYTYVIAWAFLFIAVAFGVRGASLCQLCQADSFGCRLVCGRGSLYCRFCAIAARARSTPSILIVVLTWAATNGLAATSLG